MCNSGKGTYKGTGEVTSTFSVSFAVFIVVRCFCYLLHLFGAAMHFLLHKSSFWLVVMAHNCIMRPGGTRESNVCHCGEPSVQGAQLSAILGSGPAEPWQNFLLLGRTSSILATFRTC